MSDPKYFQSGTKAAAIHLIEEAGEVIQAATKLLRFGASNYDPRLIDPPTNFERLRDEMYDLIDAWIRLRAELELEKRQEEVKPSTGKFVYAPLTRSGKDDAKPV